MTTRPGKEKGQERESERKQTNKQTGSGKEKQRTKIKLIGWKKKLEKENEKLN